MRKTTKLLIGTLVVVIMGLVAMVVTVNVSSPVHNAMLSAASATLDSCGVALRRFQSDCGVFPDDQQGLKALLVNPGLARWKGPYISRDAIDPWGTPIAYSHQNGAFALRSAGPDLKLNTADDITK